MAKDREIVCKYYSFEGGPCKKRDIAAHFRRECQTCKYWNPRKNGKPSRIDLRRKKEKDFYKKIDY